VEVVWDCARYARKRQTLSSLCAGDDVHRMEGCSAPCMFIMLLLICSCCALVVLAIRDFRTFLVPGVAGPGHSP
jgi:hypothetical protein